MKLYRFFAIALTLTAPAFITACEDDEEDQVDDATDDVEDAVDETTDDVTDAVDEAAQSTAGALE